MKWTSILTLFIFFITLTKSEMVFSRDGVSLFESQTVLISSEKDYDFIPELAKVILEYYKKSKVTTVQSRKEVLKELELIQLGVGEDEFVNAFRLKKPDYIVDIRLNSNNKLVVSLVLVDTSEIIRVWIQGQKELLDTFTDKVIEDFKNGWIFVLPHSKEMGCSILPYVLIDQLRMSPRIMAYQMRSLRIKMSSADLDNYTQNEVLSIISDIEDFYGKTQVVLSGVVKKMTGCFIKRNINVCRQVSRELIDTAIIKEKTDKQVRRLNRMLGNSGAHGEMSSGPYADLESLITTIKFNNDVLSYDIAGRMYRCNLRRI